MEGSQGTALPRASAPVPAAPPANPSLGLRLQQPLPSSVLSGLQDSCKLFADLGCHLTRLQGWVSLRGQGLNPHPSSSWCQHQAGG